MACDYYVCMYLKPPPPAALMPGGGFETKPKSCPSCRVEPLNAMQMLRGLREKRKMKVTPGGDGEERMMQNVPVRVTEMVCGLRPWKFEAELSTSPEGSRGSRPGNCDVRCRESVVSNEVVVA
jgi:hypothetical protein